MATSPNATQITPPRVPIIDERTGAVSREWYRWFYSLYNIVGGGLGIVPVPSGGTGLSTIPTNGQLLIGNGTGYTLNTLGTGAGISVTNGAGTISVANTGVLSNIAGSGITVSGATGDVTITNAGVLSFSAGTTGLTPAAATTGDIVLAGTLGITNGGTNGSATPTAGAVAYGTGTAYGFTAAGSAGQVLTSNGAGVPTWTTLTSGTSILYGDGSGGFSNVTIGTGVSFAGGTLSATGTGGTVTSVTGTSPVVSSGGTTPAISLASGYGDTQNPYASKTANYVLAAPNGSAGVPTFRALVAADVPGSALTKTDDTNVTLTLGGSPITALLNAASLTLGWSGQLAVGRGGTGLSAGTSGGIPYFSSTSAMTSSAALAANDIVLGGGAGAAPATTTTGTGVVTALGINTGTAGAFVVNGGALGTPSSGTVTNLTGTASININGTVGATTANTGAFTTLSATGVTTVQAGTALLPAITTTGDTDTGIFFPAANTIAFTTNGVDRARFSSGFLGINNSSPATYLDIVGAVGTVTSPTFLNQTIAVLRNNFHARMAFVNPSNTYSGDISRYNASAAFPTNTISLNGSSGFVFTSGDGTVATTEKMRIDQSGNVLVTNATGGLGYGTGSGGTVTQGTSRATAVTLNKFTGAITMFTAAGSLTWSQFTVNNSLVAATDTIIINQKSGAVNYYVYQILAVTAGSFNIGFASVSGVASDAPVLSFTIIKGVTA